MSSEVDIGDVSELPNDVEANGKRINRKTSVGITSQPLRYHIHQALVLQTEKNALLKNLISENKQTNQLLHTLVTMNKI